MTHDFGNSSGLAAFYSHYALHYADTKHELRPVTEGYRLALAYNVCWMPDHEVSSPTARALTAVEGDLVKALHALKEEQKEDPLVSVWMEHEYTGLMLL